MRQNAPNVDIRNAASVSMLRRVMLGHRPRGVELSFFDWVAKCLRRCTLGNESESIPCLDSMSDCNATS